MNTKKVIKVIGGCDNEMIAPESELFSRTKFSVMSNEKWNIEDFEPIFKTTDEPLIVRSRKPNPAQSFQEMITQSPMPLNGLSGLTDRELAMRMHKAEYDEDDIVVLSINNEITRRKQSRRNYDLLFMKLYRETYHKAYELNKT